MSERVKFLRFVVIAVEVVVSNVLAHVEGSLHDELDGGRGLGAEVSDGHRRGHIDRGQRPEEDHGKEAAHGEDHEGVADPADGADGHNNGEQEEHAQEPHGDRP